MKIDSVRVIQYEHLREVEVMVDLEVQVGWDCKNRLTFYLWTTKSGGAYLAPHVRFEFSRDSKRRTHRKIFESKRGPYVRFGGSGRLYLPTAEHLVAGIADGSVPVILHMDYIDECVERKIAKERAQRDRVLGR